MILSSRALASFGHCSQTIRFTIYDDEEIVYIEDLTTCKRF
nr:MAG TPA: hypothetical protein [Caudoviricetes sp.]